MRRPARHSTAGRYLVCDLAVDVRQRKLSRPEGDLELITRVFDLLRELLQPMRRLDSRLQLLDIARLHAQGDLRAACVRADALATQARTRGDAMIARQSSALSLSRWALADRTTTPASDTPMRASRTSNHTGSGELRARSCPSG